MKQFKARTGRYGKRHTPGVMNATEARYAAELAHWRDIGTLEWFAFEAMSFKLAGEVATNTAWYTPDFAVLHTDGTLELIDVKGAGPINDAALLKLKVAADQFPFYLWTMMRARTKKLGGGWDRREF